MAVTDFYTYLQERSGGVAASGSPITYKYTAPGSGGDIAQGELVAWDQTGAVVVRFVRTAPSDFIGITRESALSIQKLGNQTALKLTEISVMTTGIHQMLGTSGDTYHHGDAVYMSGTNTQAITNAAGNDVGAIIGRVWLPDGTTKSGAVYVPFTIDDFTRIQTGAGATAKV